MVLPEGKWRWIAAAAVMLLVFAACELLLARHRSPQLVVSSIVAVFPADGREHAVLRVARPDDGRVAASETTAEIIARSGVEGFGGPQIVQKGKELEVWIHAPVIAGEQQVRVIVRSVTDPIVWLCQTSPDSVRPM